MIAIGTELDLAGPSGWITFELPKPATDSVVVAPTAGIPIDFEPERPAAWRAPVAAGVSAMLGVAIGAIGLAALTPDMEQLVDRGHDPERHVEEMQIERDGEVASSRHEGPPAIPSAMRDQGDNSMLRTAEVIRAAIKRAQERERAGGIP